MRSLATALLSATIVCASATASQAEIRIAVAGPMTGSLALLGLQMRSGAEAAIARINQAGGLLGEEVVLEIADDSCSADRAEAVANQLAGAGVVLVVGHLCSAAAIAAAEVYAAETIIEIAPGAPDPRYTDERPGPGIFRLFGREDRQGPAIAERLAALPPEQTIAVLDDRSPYGRRLADSVVDALEAAGRPADLTAFYSIGDPGFEGLIGDLEAAGIDAVVVAGAAESVADFRVAMVTEGLGAALVGGDTLSAQAFADSAGDAADGVLFTYQPDPADDPAASEALADIRAANGTVEGFALYAYAAVETWAEAVRQTGTTDFESVVAAIAGGTFETAIGQVSFNAIGDYQGSEWVWYVWRNGVIELYQQ